MWATLSKLIRFLRSLHIPCIFLAHAVNDFGSRLLAPCLCPAAFALSKGGGCGLGLGVGTGPLFAYVLRGGFHYARSRYLSIDMLSSLLGTNPRWWTSRSIADSLTFSPPSASPRIKNFRPRPSFKPRRFQLLSNTSGVSFILFRLISTLMTDNRAIF